MSIIEPAVFKKINKTISLSEQQLVDCTYGRDGCNGGWMSDAYYYLKTTLGSDLQSSYPVKYF